MSKGRLKLEKSFIFIRKLVAVILGLIRELFELPENQEFHCLSPKVINWLASASIFITVHVSLFWKHGKGECGLDSMTKQTGKKWDSLEQRRTAEDQSC